MLAKALAKESGATFINIAASVLTNKWYGESNKLVAGLFSLARKTQPSIVFIDEIDSFLRERTKGDHEVTGMMKAEFMTFVSTLLHPSSPRSNGSVGYGMVSYQVLTEYLFSAPQIDLMISTPPFYAECPSGSQSVFLEMINDSRS